MTAYRASLGRMQLSMVLAAIVAEVLAYAFIPLPARVLALPLMVLFALGSAWFLMGVQDDENAEERPQVPPNLAPAWKKLPPAALAPELPQWKKKPLWRLLRCLLFGVALQLGTLALGYLSLHLLSWLPDGLFAAPSGNYLPSLPILILSSCFLAPIAEELLYRFALPGTVQYFGASARTSAILCALIFACAHCAPRAIPALFFFGLCLDAIVRRYGLRDAILTHAFYNTWTMVSAYFLYYRYVL